jgi:cell division protein FtsQ
MDVRTRSTPRAAKAGAPLVLPLDVRLMHAIAAAIFIAAALLIVAAALAWITRQPYFQIRAISVQGELHRNNLTTLRANVAPRLAGNFFSLDLQRAREAFESVPWVRQAVVTRWWPNRIVVRLIEQQPVALWDNEGRQDRLVNQQGEVFEANVGDVEDDSLPTLGGPEGTSAQVLQMVHRLQPVFARMDAAVDSLKLSSRGSWRATLDTGAVIEIGRGSDDEVAERADRFVRTVAQVSGKFDRPVQYADLRHPDGYALRLKGVSTTIDAPSAGAAAARAPAR